MAQGIKKKKRVVSARKTAPSIPYYTVRAVIERAYGRARYLTQGLLFGIAAEIIWGVNAFIIQPSIFAVKGGQVFDQFIFAYAVAFVQMLILAAIGIIAALAWVVVQVILSALNYGDREELLVEQCVTTLASLTPTDRATINEMAAQGSNAAQIRSALPITLLSAIAAATAIQDLPQEVAILFAAIVVIVLLAFALLIGESYADIVIQRALSELRRREQP